VGAARLKERIPQELNVVYQDVVYIELIHSEVEGYGKDGKLENAFHFPTTPAAATGFQSFDIAHLPGAKAAILLEAAFGTAKAVPFQNNGRKRKQCIETLQLKPGSFWRPHSARQKACP
jgi:hypothetical protein